MITNNQIINNRLSQLVIFTGNIQPKLWIILLLVNKTNFFT